MSKGTRRLGRGLSSLITADLQQPATAQGTCQKLEVDAAPAFEGHATSGPAHRLMMIPVDKVRQNPMQPRRVFDLAGLESLAESLKAQGALQPIVVRPSEGGYELVSGERRLRAAKLAEIKELPAIVRAVHDENLLELALIENVQRADLNPIERARAYRTLNVRHKLSHEDIALRMGEDRATVTNYIRLLGLPDPVLEMVADGALSSGHAKVLLGVADPELQLALADRTTNEQWSVRQLEAAVAAGGRKEKKGGGKRNVRPAVADMEERITRTLGTKVTIREGRRRHTGKLVLEYYSLDEFERIIALLGVQGETT